MYIFIYLYIYINILYFCYCYCINIYGAAVGAAEGYLRELSGRGGIIYIYIYI